MDRKGFLGALLAVPALIATKLRGPEPEPVVLCKKETTFGVERPEPLRITTISVVGGVEVDRVVSEFLDRALVDRSKR